MVEGVIKSPEAAEDEDRGRCERKHSLLFKFYFENNERGGYTQGTSDSSPVKEQHLGGQGKRDKDPNSGLIKTNPKIWKYITKKEQGDCGEKRNCLS